MKSSRSSKLNGRISSILLLLLFPATAIPQVSREQLENSLRQVREVVQRMDDMAADCASAGTDAIACPAFRQALDTELLPAYIDNCATAKSWRDEYVTNRVQSDRSADSSDQNQTILDYFVEIEFLCGENALARATDFVLPAYRAARPTPSPGALQLQLDSYRLQGLRNEEQFRQSQNLIRQRERMQRQTTRQFEQLELELIRQQNAPRYPR